MRHTSVKDLPEKYAEGGELVVDGADAGVGLSEGDVGAWEQVRSDVAQMSHSCGTAIAEEEMPC